MSQDLNKVITKLSKDCLYNAITNLEDYSEWRSLVNPLNKGIIDNTIYGIYEQLQQMYFDLCCETEGGSDE